MNMQNQTHFEPKGEYATPMNALRAFNEVQRAGSVVEILTDSFEEPVSGKVMWHDTNWIAVSVNGDDISVISKRKIVEIRYKNVHAEIRA